MESQTKYLDELIYAIKESRLNENIGLSNNNNNYNLDYNELNSELNLNTNDNINNSNRLRLNESKSIEILYTLLMNLKNLNKNNYDELFMKFIQAIDLLILSKPIILLAKMDSSHNFNSLSDDTKSKILPNKSNSENIELIVMEEIILDFTLISINNFDKLGRLWLLKEKFIQWCQLFVQLNGYEGRLIISKSIELQINNCENNIAKVLTGNYPLDNFLLFLKKITIFCYWLGDSNQGLINCINTINSALTINKWSLHFEKIIRFIFFIFKSVKLTNNKEYIKVQLRFISVVVNQFINNSITNNLKNVSIINFKFTLQTLHKFIKNKFGVLKNDDDPILAKCILRLYSFCCEEKIDIVTRQNCFKIFVDYFPIEPWLDIGLLIDTNQHTTLPFNNLTIKAILIVYFDMKRRLLSDNLLYFDKRYNFTCIENEVEELFDIISAPFKISFKQLEKLRNLIIYSFEKEKRNKWNNIKSKLNILIYELNNIDPGIVKRCNGDLDKMYEEIALSLQKCFNTYDNSKLILWTKIISKLACIEASCAGKKLPNPFYIENFDYCMLCDYNQTRITYENINPSRPEASNCKAYSLMNKYFLSNARIEDFSEGLLVGILSCLQRIFHHYQPPELIKRDKQGTVINTSSCFELVKKCFTNPVRYLRLISVSIIPLLNITDLHNDKEENASSLIEFVNTVNDRVMIETVVMAWTRLFLTINNELKNLILLKIIDTYNSEDYTKRTMMEFNIRSLAKTLKKTPYQLILPIVPILMNEYGRFLIQRKASFQRLSYLLEFDEKSVILMFQRDIIPSSIMQHETDVFSEIALIANESDDDLESIKHVMQELLDNNKSEIFAIALVKHEIFSLDTLETLFTNRAPDFNRATIIQNLPAFVTLAEVTKFYKNSDYDEQSDEEDKSKNKKYKRIDDMVLASLRYLLTDFSNDKRHGNKYRNIENWTSTQEKSFQNNLRDNLLGIFQIFSSNIHDIEGITSSYEKSRIINGISFLIKITVKDSIISALAQISICLQTGLGIAELRYNSLRAWLLLIEKLNDNELAPVIDGLVSFILQNWCIFDKKLKDVVYKIFDVIVKKKTELITKYKPYITYALAHNNDLALTDNNDHFARFARKTIQSTEFLSIFADNLKSNNKYVVAQNLDDIEEFLEKRQIRQKNNGIFDPKYTGSNITILLGALLNTSHRFRATDIKLCEKCTKCISMIGMLDVTKHSLTGLKKKNSVYFLEDDEQVMEFLIWMINDVLVPSFWQSENPRIQLFFAFVMQESLKFCNLNSEVWDVNKKDEDSPEASRWKKFNPISQTTLYPLLSSIYVAQSGEYTTIKYPVFKHEEGYLVWIKKITLELLKIGTEEGSPLRIFASLIRTDDGLLSNLLLPYLVVDVITKTVSDERYSSLLSNIVLEFRHVFDLKIEELTHLQQDSLKMAYESIFNVLAYCKKWVIEFKKDHNAKYGSSNIKNSKSLARLNKIDEFLNSIPSYVLAKRSLETNSFERSALYLEDCYRQQSNDKKQHKDILKDLQSTYEQIGDIDSIDGMLKSFAFGNLESKITELQYSDNWKMAEDCFGALGNFYIESPSTIKMLKSNYDHQLHSEVLKNLNLMLPENTVRLTDDMNEIYSIGIESANLSGDINYINGWIEKVEKLQHTPNYNVILHYNVAKALHFIYQKNFNKSKEYINKCFRFVGTHFTTFSTSTSLLKQQSILMKLHSLYDLLILGATDHELRYKENADKFDFRLERVGADFKPNHYLLSMKKSFEMLNNEEYSDQVLNVTNFRIAQLARFNSRLDIAGESLMKCLKYNHPRTELEFAEILWKTGENDRALKLVEEINERYNNQNDVNNRDRATVLLKYTEWLDLSNNSASMQIIEQYKEIFHLDSKWYEPYYSIGLYFSRLLERKMEEGGYKSVGELEYKSISYFLMAFKRNPIKVRENLPKVVTFWLDTASASKTCNIEKQRTQLKSYTQEICKNIEESCKNGPSYIWYFVLTQLLSRLLHPHETTATLIEAILLKLSIDYPSHMLWYISVLMNSKNNGRIKIGRKIMSKYKNANPDFKGSDKHEMVKASQNLINSLTDVCVKTLKNTKTRSGNSLINDFNFNMDIAPCEIVVPVQINLEILSPTSSESMKTPFRNKVTIEKFSSRYTIFSSLKKPKKINILGSDGKIYGIMCKMEDVRQDNQYMQFASTMDFLLNKDVESTKRNLGITTYSVLSLREDCGLIEMVPNVTTLRSILFSKYEDCKINYKLPDLYGRWHDLKGKGDDAKMNFYQEQISLFPAVLYQWFLESFPDPIDWFKARNNYARSYSVMAMVGYILGLGDRHCENILLSVETGKVLHVDFDCLFEKGKSLPVPELVPFRLTRNLIDAFGIIGTEGTFKKSSEVTLELMRRYEVSLVNVIETIMYDRTTDASLKGSMKLLRNKIRGIDERDGLVLSVPGQVETLIQASTSESNLSMMYIGWLPFW